MLPVPDMCDKNNWTKGPYTKLTLCKQIWDVNQAPNGPKMYFKFLGRSILVSGFHRPAYYTGGIKYYRFKCSR